MRNFGSPHPEGYRKALRLMQLAEKFEVPVICFIDTPGAYPAVGARGAPYIAEAIRGQLQREMMVLRTPSIAIVIGEGGSGGALGIGVCDRVLILENAYYSVISPEGCAAILWKDRANAAQAAAALKITAKDLLELDVVDEVIPEPLGGAHKEYDETAVTLKKAILKHLDKLWDMKMSDLLEARYKKFRKMGVFERVEPKKRGRAKKAVTSASTAPSTT